ncbi:MAG: LptF/LptG family permease [Pirellulales bacterium]|nr:LptF/LptG family permease [Pirellulales bacterium]
MRIVSRYVLFELLKTFIATATGLTMMMIVIGVVQEAHRQGLGPAQVVRMLPFILPDALRFSLPATILFTTSSVYGRMSSSNEIVALKSAGVSPLAVLMPVYALATVLSLATVWFNDVAVSWGREGIRRTALEAAEEIIYGMLRTQRTYSTSNLSINVKRVEGRRLLRPTLSFQAAGNRPAVTVMAEWAEMRSDAGKKLLTVACHNFTVHSGGKATLTDPGTFELEIPLEDASRSGKASVLPAYMPLRSIPKTIREQVAVQADLEQQLALDAGVDLMAGDFSQLGSATWQGNNQTLKDVRGYIARLRLEPYRRWANGFSCLCFVLVGAPITIRRRNADFLTSFFLCFLPILVVYYPLLAVGVDGAKNGTLPPYSVWLGNVVFGAVGIWQLRWVTRY